MSKQILSTVTNKKSISKKESPSKGIKETQPSKIFSKPLFAICLTFLVFLGIAIIIAYKQYNTDKQVEIENFYLTNVTDSSATIVWTTKTPTYGAIIISSSQIDSDIYVTTAQNIFHDDRSTRENSEGRLVVDGDLKVLRKTHHVTIRSLNPETKYFFKIKNGLALIEPNTNSFTTANTAQKLTQPEPVYGRVQIDNEIDNSDINDGIIILQRQSKSGQASHYASTVLRNGTYSLDIAYLLKETLDDIYINDDIDDQTITSLANINNDVHTSQLIITSDNNQPVPTIIFSKEIPQELSKGNRLVSYVNANSCVQHTCYAGYACKHGETCGNCADNLPCTSCKSEDGSKECAGPNNPLPAGTTCNCIAESNDPLVQCCCGGRTVAGTTNGCPASCSIGACEPATTTPTVCCCRGETLTDAQACTNCARSDPNWTSSACTPTITTEGFCANMDDATWGGAGNYCNGSDLWHCGSRSGNGNKIETCVNGCIREAAGKADRCNTGSTQAPPERSPCGPNAWTLYGCSADTPINWPTDLVEKVNRGEGSCIMAMCGSGGVRYEIDGCNCSQQCNNPIYRPNDPQGCDCPPEYPIFRPGEDAITVNCTRAPQGCAGICCREECPEETHELVYNGFNGGNCSYYGNDQWCCPRSGQDSSTCWGSDTENGVICNSTNYRTCNPQGTKRCTSWTTGECEWRLDDSCSQSTCEGERFEDGEKCSTDNFGDCHSFSHLRCRTGALGSQKCDWRLDNSCPDSTRALECLGSDVHNGESCTSANYTQCHTSDNRICDRDASGYCKWRSKAGQPCPAAQSGCTGSDIMDGLTCDNNNFGSCHTTKARRKCSRNASGECHWRIDNWCRGGSALNITDEDMLFGSVNTYIKDYLTKDEFIDNLNKGNLIKLVSPVSANSDKRKVLLAPDSNLYAFEEAGRYSFNFEGEVFYFDIPTPGAWQLYIDVNRNNVLDEEDILLAQEEVIEIEVEKVAEVVKYNLNQGWNLIAFPMVIQGENTSEIKTASDLLKFLKDNGADVTHVATYNSGFQIYSNRETYEGDTASYGEDFNIYPGFGYFIKSYNSVSVTIQGDRIKDSLEIRLKPSWNLVGIYNEKQSTFSSLELLQDINKKGIEAKILSRWQNGKYQGLVIDKGTVYGEDFELLPTKGYWIRMDGNETVKYKP